MIINLKSVLNNKVRDELVDYLNGVSNWRQTYNTDYVIKGEKIIIKKNRWSQSQFLELKKALDHFKLEVESSDPSKPNIGFAESLNKPKTLLAELQEQLKVDERYISNGKEKVSESTSFNKKKLRELLDEKSTKKPIDFSKKRKLKSGQSKKNTERAIAHAKEMLGKAKIKLADLQKKKADSEVIKDAKDAVEFWKERIITNTKKLHEEKELTDSKKVLSSVFTILDEVETLKIKIAKELKTDSKLKEIYTKLLNAAGDLQDHLNNTYDIK